MYTYKITYLDYKQSLFISLKWFFNLNKQYQEMKITMNEDDNKILELLYYFILTNT